MGALNLKYSCRKEFVFKDDSKIEEMYNSWLKITATSFKMKNFMKDLKKKKTLNAANLYTLVTADCYEEKCKAYKSGSNGLTGIVLHIFISNC